MPRRFSNGRGPLILFWIKYTGWITLFLRNAFVQKRSESRLLNDTSTI